MHHYRDGGRILRIRASSVRPEDCSGSLSKDLLIATVYSDRVDSNTLAPLFQQEGGIY
jgi:hypothetical protein